MQIRTATSADLAAVVQIEAECFPVNKPAVFGDFVALREKITQVCDHTY